MAAGGQALVDSKRGRTLYAFSGDLKNDKVACAQGATCDNGFTPVLAPQLAEPLSDFAPISRSDGTRQWAYQGEPLYTYDGDAEHGDSKGRAVDPRFHVALAEKYFQPDNVAFGINVRGMDYLTDAKGMTIYARDRFHFQVGGFSLRGGQAGVPQLGQFLGTSTCTGDCTKTWIPVVGPRRCQAGRLLERDEAQGRRQPVGLYGLCAVHLYRRPEAGRRNLARQFRHLAGEDPARDPAEPDRRGVGAVLAGSAAVIAV